MRWECTGDCGSSARGSAQCLLHQAAREIESAGKAARHELRKFAAEESVRLAEEILEKEIRPEDLLIDFNNQEASKPLVSNKSTGSKSNIYKKYEEYGTAGSSGLTHNEKATPVVTVDDDEDNELYKSEKKKKKKNKKHNKPKNK